jgi:hypothetical protein
LFDGEVEGELFDFGFEGVVLVGQAGHEVCLDFDASSQAGDIFFGFDAVDGVWGVFG